MERLTERHHKKEDAGLAHGWISVEERQPGAEGGRGMKCKFEHDDEGTK